MSRLICEVSFWFAAAFFVALTIVGVAVLLGAEDPAVGYAQPGPVVMCDGDACLPVAAP